MSIRIGINGFGRMGRLVMRAAWGWPDLAFVHVNEIKGGVDTAAHLLEFDTVHGRYPGNVAVDGDAMVIDGRLPSNTRCGASRLASGLLFPMASSCASALPCCASRSPCGGWATRAQR